MAIPPRTRGALEERGQRSFLLREVVLPVQEFISTEASSGFALLVAALLALIWANSPWQQSYEDLWHATVTLDLALFSLSLDLRHWVNDGLMTIFFFVVGLEIKRELVHGELSKWQQVSLPLFGAAGGMLLPALIFTGFNLGRPTLQGWAVPTATDIAFALGVLALAGRGLPSGLRVFLLGLAVVDDMGGVLIIALFYTKQLSFPALAAGFALVIGIWGLTRFGIRSTLVYTLLGVALWLAVFKSGVHAAIAGFLLGALVPAAPYYSMEHFETNMRRLLARFREARSREAPGGLDAIVAVMEELSRGTESSVERLERLVHPWSSYLVVPLFALANAGVSLEPQAVAKAVFSPVSLGIFLGLFLGKPLGIGAAAWIAVRLGLASLPAGVRWPQVLGVGWLGGIGFTVSLFIATLSFADDAVLSEAKIGILFGSACAGVAGISLLRLVASARATPSMAS